MTPERWAKLRRGDILRHKDYPSHFHTIYGFRSNACMLTIIGIAGDPSEWIQVNEQMQDIDELGNPIVPPLPDCPMCDGAGAAHHDGAMQICPLCAGRCKEPAGLKKQVIRMDIFSPSDERLPLIRFNAETELHHGQLIELLASALNVLKASNPEELKNGGMPGLVS